MSPVLSKSTLHELEAFLEAVEPDPAKHDPSFFAWQRNLLRHVEAALKPKRSVKLARKRRETKRQTRKEKWADIRGAVLARAHGFCESMDPACPCDDGDGLEVDHFFGGSGRRRALESEATCWALCRHCHWAKTNNLPNAAHWADVFREHCITKAHEAESRAAVVAFDGAAAMAQARLESLEIQGRAGTQPTKGNNP